MELIHDARALSKAKPIHAGKIALARPALLHDLIFPGARVTWVS
uniref:Uncharacterized protein n=1 Tax=Candidatus Kentrum sp. SD TaxID=2126332 RepID=A0A450Z349_9GAMM|nr:MAG: hypothetical protein BECKSD772F_GA0070984_11202 [Candidatus Kentron sp. SD]VFK48211.1 MAG: hypothetical protein BECKSD772E_GA0070983_11172 [Candidatus Kentron sp. SD]VFK79811.1 MAG: hypothetical protein BECKSD772D_GA0070982_10676 [Candidatus Kentron sp. SD]